MEILPKNTQVYNTEFTPSEDGVQRHFNKRIRKIDGRSFYELVTGDSNSLSNLYKMLPIIICEILEEEFSIERDYKKFFNQSEFDYIFPPKD